MKRPGVDPSMRGPNLEPRLTFAYDIVERQKALLTLTAHNFGLAGVPESTTREVLDMASLFFKEVRIAGKVLGSDSFRLKEMAPFVNVAESDLHRAASKDYLMFDTVGRGIRLALYRDGSPFAPESDLDLLADCDNRYTIFAPPEAPPVMVSDRLIGAVAGNEFTSSLNDSNWPLYVRREFGDGAVHELTNAACRSVEAALKAPELIDYRRVASLHLIYDEKEGLPYDYKQRMVVHANIDALNAGRFIPPQT